LFLLVHSNLYIYHLKKPHKIEENGKYSKQQVKYNVVQLDHSTELFAASLQPWHDGIDSTIGSQDI